MEVHEADSAAVIDKVLPNVCTSVSEWRRKRVHARFVLRANHKYQSSDEGKSLIDNNIFRSSHVHALYLELFFVIPNDSLDNIRASPSRTSTSKPSLRSSTSKMTPNEGQSHAGRSRSVEPAAGSSGRPRTRSHDRNTSDNISGSMQLHQNRPVQAPKITMPHTPSFMK